MCRDQVTLCFFPSTGLISAMLKPNKQFQGSMADVQRILVLTNLPLLAVVGVGPLHTPSATH